MIDQELKLLNEGRLLPIMETFSSIQGEGQNTGKAAFFIRIGGCDVGCQWCDVKESWNAATHPLTPIESLISIVDNSSIKSVIITGGEPLKYNLDLLCSLLKEKNITTFLETSGTEILSGKWDWICLSPKRNAPPLPQFYAIANELKVIISEESDFCWAEENAVVANSDCILFLQPEWSVKNHITPLIVEYVLNYPKWKISVQTHKYIRIP